ncbi:MAG: hypothetical protein HOG92_00245 [Methylococcales bacterium]|jgi:hypothetical protein|nr:hypothetical protein [Methylococcales bacterium]MBT5951639.1 hypothetical protein [Methylococcales bacterium]HIG92014.1 hypothetical protein [Methylococcaceae bacterium]
MAYQIEFHIDFYRLDGTVITKNGVYGFDDEEVGSIEEAFEWFCQDFADASEEELVACDDIDFEEIKETAMGIDTITDTTEGIKEEYV